MRRLPLVAVFGLALPLAATAAPRPSTFDERARFLAGLPGPAGAPLGALEGGPAWAQHRTAMDASWTTVEARLRAFSAWQAAELAPKIRTERPLVYLFGGPDALTAVHLFPDAPRYLLAGLEPVGTLDPPEAMTAAARAEALQRLSSGLRTLVRAGFFRTSEMSEDLAGHGIRGVLPVILLFLARSGATVTDVTRIEVDGTGVVAEKEAGAPFGAGAPGIRVRFRRGTAEAQELLYVRGDLSDEALQRKGAIAALTARLAPFNAFLKAASFILHDRAFSTPRRLLLEHAAAILQDDSGIPFHAFSPEAWELVCAGRYAAPRKPFASHYQAELARLFERCTTPLPFLIGYRGRDDANLLLALRKPPARAAAKP